ncbi:helix-turn-helix transcriptional regulator [Nonomuraea sp. NPDC050786]|uniref:helix-turn-helix domain-containing protein n=1 Tax=Nonomuraea sp. NPDC050786 TaxID=3154840 RepID=UPI0033F3F38A
MSASGEDAIRQLGAALRARRLAQGLSLRALAREVGLGGHGTLVDYEHGRRLPPLDLLTAFERVLKVPQGELLQLRAAALAERGRDEAARLLKKPPPGPTPAPADAPPRLGVSSEEQSPSSAGHGTPQSVVTAPERRHRRVWFPFVIALTISLVVAATLVTASRLPNWPASARTAVNAPYTPAPTVRMDFEQPGERLSVFWGSQVATAGVTSTVARHGRQAVLVTVKGASAEKGYSAVGVTHGLTGLRPGMKVTVWLWVPGAQPGGLRFFAMNSASKPVWAPETLETEIALPMRAGWSSVDWTIPQVDRLHAIGMQFYAETDATMSVGIDAITW